MPSSTAVAILTSDQRLASLRLHAKAALPLPRLIDPELGIELAGERVGERCFLRVVLGFGKFENGLRFATGDADQAIIVAEHEVAGFDNHAIQRNRNVDFAWPVFVRPTVGHTGSEYRKGICFNPALVPNGSVYYHADHAEFYRLRQHQFSDKRVRQLTTTIDDKRSARI